MSTYYVAGVPYSSELYHHGIKGQRWGVRRFQNLDRTLTPAGKERYKKYSQNPERIASRIHESSSAAVVDKKRRDRMFKAIEPTLSEASNRLREDAIRVYEKNNASDNALGDVVDYVSKNYRDLVGKHISKKEIRDLENYYGEKYGDPDYFDPGDNTVREGVRDMVYSRFMKTNHPVVKRYDELFKDSMEESERFKRSCKEYTEAFLGEYGEDSAVSLRSRGNQQIITTVNDVLGDLIRSRALDDAFKQYKWK